MLPTISNIEFEKNEITKNLTLSQRFNINQQRGITSEKVSDFVKSMKEDIAEIASNYDSFEEYPKLALRARLSNQITDENFASICLLYQATSQFIKNITPLLLYETTTSGGNSNFYNYLLPKTELNHRPDLETFDINDDDLEKARIIKTIIRKYFNFTDVGFERLKKAMQEHPKCERCFHTIPLPLGHPLTLSNFYQQIATVQGYFHPVISYKPSKTKSTFGIESTHVVVPSFTLFKESFKIAFEEHAFDLMPLLGEISPETITRYKMRGIRIIGVGMPGADVSQYPDKVYAGLYVSSLHDMYHAFRYSIVKRNENNALVRINTLFREEIKKVKTTIDKAKLGSSERYEASNRLKELRHTKWMLIDGELHKSLFQKEKFGTLFQLEDKGWKPEFVQLIIQDMVTHSEVWEKEFDLNHTDLLPEEQQLYAKLSGKKAQEIALVSIKDFDQLEVTRHLSADQREVLAKKLTFRNELLEQYVRELSQVEKYCKHSQIPDHYDLYHHYELYPLVALHARFKGLITDEQLADACMLYQAMDQLVVNRVLVSTFRNSTGKIAQTVTQFRDEQRPFIETFHLFEANENKRKIVLNYIQQFFDLSPSSMDSFVEKMSKFKGTSQACFHAIDLPLGSVVNWAPVYTKISSIIEAFKPVTKKNESESEYSEEEQVMIIPSFVMVQTFLDVAFLENAYRLAPILGNVESATLEKFKMDKKRIVQISVPSVNPKMWGNEYAGSIVVTYFHFYYALRYSTVPVNDDKALCHINKLLNDGINSLKEEEKIKQLQITKRHLIDGQLHKSLKDKFGVIFNKEDWSEFARYFVIRDFVTQADNWNKSFNLKRENLLEPEQELYDQIQKEVDESQIFKKQKLNSEVDSVIVSET